MNVAGLPSGVSPDDRDRPAGPRPLAVDVAAISLGALGLIRIGLAFVDVGGLLGGLLAEEPVDAMTAVVTWLIGGLFVAVLGGVAIVGLFMVVTAIRLLRRARWAWVEAIIAAAVGLGFVVIDATDPPAAGSVAAALFGLYLVGAVAGHLAAAVLALLARPWFGRLRFPRTNDELPYWLRFFPRLNVPGRLD